MSDERWEEIVKNNEMINDILLKLGERLKNLEKYVQALPTPVSYTHLTLPTNREV